MKRCLDSESVLGSLVGADLGLGFRANLSSQVTVPLRVQGIHLPSPWLTERTEAHVPSVLSSKPRVVVSRPNCTY